MRWPYEPQTAVTLRPQTGKIFEKLGYSKVSQKGSHIKLRNDETGNIIIIPDHKELDRWTLKTILTQADIRNDELEKYL